MENLAFGGVLRRLRIAKGVSMGQLARHLEVTVPYISDVEKGARPPLTEPRVRSAAQLLGVEESFLLDAAARGRSKFVLDAASVPPEAREVGIALQRQWPTLTPEQLNQIRDVLNRKV